MPSSNRPKWYAVAAGHSRGVFTSWDLVEPLVRGYPNARHKSFTTEAEAVQWLQQYMDATSASNPLRHPDATQHQQQGPSIFTGAHNLSASGAPPAVAHVQTSGHQTIFSTGANTTNSSGSGATTDDEDDAVGPQRPHHIAAAPPPPVAGFNPAAVATAPPPAAAAVGPVVGAAPFAVSTPGSACSGNDADQGQQLAASGRMIPGINGGYYHVEHVDHGRTLDQADLAHQRFTTAKPSSSSRVGKRPIGSGGGGMSGGITQWINGKTSSAASASNSNTASSNANPHPVRSSVPAHPHPTAPSSASSYDPGAPSAPNSSRPSFPASSSTCTPNLPAPVPSSSGSGLVPDLPPPLTTAARRERRRQQELQEMSEEYQLLLDDDSALTTGALLPGTTEGRVIVPVLTIWVGTAVAAAVNEESCKKRHRPPPPQYGRPAGPADQVASHHDRNLVTSAFVQRSRDRRTLHAHLLPTTDDQTAASGQPPPHGHQTTINQLQGQQQQPLAARAASVPPWVEDLGPNSASPAASTAAPPAASSLAPTPDNSNSGVPANPTVHPNSISTLDNSNGPTSGNTQWAFDAAELTKKPLGPSGVFDEAVRQVTDVDAAARRRSAAVAAGGVGQQTLDFAPASSSSGSPSTRRPPHGNTSNNNNSSKNHSRAAYGLYLGPSAASACPSLDDHTELFHPAPELLAPGMVEEYLGAGTFGAVLDEDDVTPTQNRAELLGVIAALRVANEWDRRVEESCQAYLVSLHSSSPPPVQRQAQPTGAPAAPLVPQATPQPARHAQPTPLAVQAAPAVVVSTWPCSICTYENKADAVRCEMCNSGRVSDANWACSCGYAFNGIETLACGLCGTTKPEVPDTTSGPPIGNANTMSMNSVPPNSSAHPTRHQQPPSAATGDDTPLSLLMKAEVSHQQNTHDGCAVGGSVVKDEHFPPVAQHQGHGGSVAHPSIIHRELDDRDLAGYLKPEPAGASHAAAAAQRLAVACATSSGAPLFADGSNVDQRRDDELTVIERQRRQDSLYGSDLYARVPATLRLPYPLHAAVVRNARPIAPCTVHVVVAGSTFVADAMAKWVYFWLKNGWRTGSGSIVAHQDLWAELLMLKASRRSRRRILFNEAMNTHFGGSREQTEAAFGISREDFLKSGVQFTGFAARGSTVAASLCKVQMGDAVVGGPSTPAPKTASVGGAVGAVTNTDVIAGDQSGTGTSSSTPASAAVAVNGQAALSGAEQNGAPPSAALKSRRFNFDEQCAAYGHSRPSTAKHVWGGPRAREARNAARRALGVEGEAEEQMRKLSRAKRRRGLQLHPTIALSDDDDGDASGAALQLPANTHASHAFHHAGHRHNQNGGDQHAHASSGRNVNRSRHGGDDSDSEGGDLDRYLDQMKQGAVMSSSEDDDFIPAAARRHPPSAAAASASASTHGRPGVKIGQAAPFQDDMRHAPGKWSGGWRDRRR